MLCHLETLKHREAAVAGYGVTVEQRQSLRYQARLTSNARNNNKHLLQTFETRGRA